MLECGVGVAHLQWVNSAKNQGGLSVGGLGSRVSTSKGQRVGITRSLGFREHVSVAEQLRMSWRGWGRMAKNRGAKAD